MPSKRQTREWSIDEKIRILAKAGKLTGAELTELLEREGLLLAEYEQWRLALAEEGRASLATTKRIRALERELARKEKALAEAAALLVLKKKTLRASCSCRCATCRFAGCSIRGSARSVEREFKELESPYCRTNWRSFGVPAITAVGRAVLAAATSSFWSFDCLRWRLPQSQ